MKGPWSLRKFHKAYWFSLIFITSPYDVLWLFSTTVNDVHGFLHIFNDLDWFSYFLESSKTVTIVAYSETFFGCHTFHHCAQNHWFSKFPQAFINFQGSASICDRFFKDFQRLLTFSSILRFSLIFTRMGGGTCKYFLYL